MKTAIVTLYHNNHNFGGQLQAFALQNKIRELGYDCEVIDLDVQDKYRKIKTLGIRKTVSRMCSKIAYRVQMRLHPQLHAGLALRRERFQAFMERIPHTEPLGKHEITERAASYDIWVTGSDQVFNPENFMQSSAYLLDHVQGKTKVAYAVSSLNGKYRKSEKAILKDSLASFTAISAREKPLAETLSEIAGREVATVLDPTLLYPSSFYDTIAQDPPTEEPYAFVYLIHPCDALKKRLYLWCRANGLKMVIVPHAQGWYKSADEKYYDEQALGIGPEEWIGYLKNASVVFTDSFHGTLFSVNYHKIFWSFDKVDPSAEEARRLRSFGFLSQVGLYSRALSYETDLAGRDLLAPPSYEQADECLDELRTASERYLKESLAGEYR